MNIIVIGDVVTDVTVDVAPSDVLSVEEVPTYWERSRLTLLGGAANVAKHCARLGARVYLAHDAGPLAFSGDDKLTSDEQLRIVQLWGGKQTITKERYYDGRKKTFKINRNTKLYGNGLKVSDAVDVIFSRFSADVVIACDNGHGMFDAEGAKILVEKCNARKKTLFVDSQLSQSRPDFSIWYGATSLFLNQTEYSSIPSSVLSNFKQYHIKLGEEGSLWVNGDQSVRQRGFKVDVFDTLGAGDAYLSAWTVFRDLKIANAWAALSCTKRATGLPDVNSMEELDEAFIGFCKPR